MFENTRFVKYFVCEVFRSVSGKLRFLKCDAVYFGASED